MECASCADFIKNKLEKNAGVDSVQIDPKKGTVVVTLKPDSKVKPQLVRDWVQQSGYQVKATTVTAVGTVEMDRGVLTLKLNEQDRITLLDQEYLLREQVRRKVEVEGVMAKSKLGDQQIDVLDVKKSKTMK